MHRDTGESQGHQLLIPATYDDCNVDFFYGDYKSPDFQTAPSPRDAQFEACLPRLNRGTGEVHLSFAVKASAGLEPYQMALSQEDFLFLHNEKNIEQMLANPENAGKVDLKLTRHDATDAGNLFIVLIDTSGSMSKPAQPGQPESRMDRVKEALMRVEAKFIQESTEQQPGSAVALFRFGSRAPGMPVELRGLNGKKWEGVKPIDFQTRAQYREMLGFLEPKFEWTALYQAVEKATTDLLQTDTEVNRFLQENRGLVPTIIVVTDGYNNIHPADTCGDNANRLGRTLQTLHTARVDEGDGKSIPVVYTIGFGSDALPVPQPDFAYKDKISETELCGDYANSTIDRVLDEKSIDGNSLEWIAGVGGGKAFITNDYRELRKSFEQTAPLRYRWYELDYKLPPDLLGKSFETKIKVKRGAPCSAKLVWRSGGWLPGGGGGCQ